MGDDGWADLVAFFTSVGYGVASAIFPPVNAEAYVVLSQVSAVIGALPIAVGVAIGQTMVIVGGGIDLSVPWTLTGAGMFVTSLSRSDDTALLWAVPLCLAFGAFVGTINGVGIARLGIPPIVMTLSMNVVLQGLLLVVTRGFPPPPAAPALQWIGSGRIGVVPVMLLTFVAAFVPIFGAIAAGVVATLVALVTAGTVPAVIVAVVALVVQQLDNDVLAPFVYGRSLQLHPVVILLRQQGAGGIE